MDVEMDERHFPPGNVPGDYSGARLPVPYVGGFGVDF